MSDFESESSVTTTEAVESEAIAKPGSVKLPYFHRTLSAEESSLIGDITPKRIDTSPSEALEVKSSLATSSAWNAAKIWEERDCTPWAKETLKSLFSESFQFTSGSLVATIDDISSISGHANITHSRGKPRYMYSFSFELSAEVSKVGSTSDPIECKINLDDVINDVLDDVEISLKWTTRPSNAETKAYNDILSGRSFLTAFKQKMSEFEAAYQSL